MTDTPSKRLARFSRRTAIAAGLTSAAAIVGHAATRPLLGPRPGWLELVDDLTPWAYLAGPALIGMGGLLRSRDTMLAGAAVCATFGARWGDRFLRPSVAAASSADLTVMTFNTLAWKRSGEDLAASIRAANADIVGLQEVGPQATEHLVEVFRDRYPYHADAPSPDSSGATVLSRYPIKDAQKLRITERSHWWQTMTVETPHGEIAYFNLHTKIPLVRNWVDPTGRLRVPLTFNSERRQQEIEKLSEMLDAETRPIVITGDFNMTERSADYAVISGRLRDAYKAVGRGIGCTFPVRGMAPRHFPFPLPVVRLDYVWYSDHFEATSAALGNPGESDHHPVIAGLRWREPVARALTGVPLAASAV